FFLFGFLSTRSLSLLAVAVVGLGLAFLISDVRGLRSRSPMLRSASHSTAAVGWVVVVILSMSFVLVAGAFDGPSRASSTAPTQTPIVTTAAVRTAAARASTPTTDPTPDATPRPTLASTVPPIVELFPTLSPIQSQTLAP